MLSRNTRHRLAQRVLWSAPGRFFVRVIDKAIVRWEAVVMNRSLNMDVNGESWLASQLPADCLVLDVGFNRGDFSALVVQGRPRARCIGFDPARSMRRHYEASYAHRDRVELVSAAVSNTAGECVFIDSDDGMSHVLSSGGDSTPPVQGSYTVPQMTLDAFTAQRSIDKVDFLKIDVEGYDLHVLEGANRLLTEERVAMFMFEYNAPWIDSRRFLREAVDFLADKPYALFRLFNGFLVPFVYSHRAERHDLGCNYVGVATKRLAESNLPIRHFP
jgi:FkbM family methyltransferase